MVPRGHYWIAAVHSRFAEASDWRQWADSEIEKSESPPYWVIALSLAASEDEFKQALAEQLETEVRETGRTIYYSEASLGYVYWRYKLGRLSFAEFLSEAGYDADCGHSDLDPESVYAILNELEKRQASSLSYDDLIAKSDDLFHSYWEVAKQQWSVLGLADPTPA